MTIFSRPFSVALVALALVLTTAVAFAAPTDDNQVIVPNGATGQPAAAPGLPTGGGAFTLVAVILLAGAGGWFVWRGRGTGPGGLSRASRQLAVEETRSLGNRQFLVVATYQNKKFLLGVCPGRIDLLAPLPEGAAPAPEKART